MVQSAALGLAIAGALGLGYSNIFVTAPSPENLRTLFEFIFKGLDQLDYKEHLDYDLVESTNPAFAKAIVRVNVFKNHRQVCALTSLLKLVVDLVLQCRAVECQASSCSSAFAGLKASHVCCGYYAVHSMEIGLLDYCKWLDAWMKLQHAALPNSIDASTRNAVS